MRRHDAAQLARELISEHCTIDGWRWGGFNNRKRGVGVAKMRTKTIEMSGPWVDLNDEADVRDTILHEIAHANVGPQRQPHGWTWKAEAMRLGANPSSTTEDTAVSVPGKWIRYCDSCGKESQLHRRSNKQWACKACCRKYNRGRYSTDYLLKVKPNPAYGRRTAA